MLSAPPNHASGAFEPLHVVGLALSAVALLIGLMADHSGWVDVGVALMLILPPLRLGTTLIAEAKAKRFSVALMGLVVLIFLLFSRRIS
ncbi:MAG: hypothetical protein ABI672_10070 [Vicinamibacteria bacterium]